MDTVLVTGVSGYLGGHVALQLLNSGYRVRGSVRSLDKAPRVKDTIKQSGGNPSNLEFVALDLNADDGWTEAAQGVRYLVHVASPFVTSMPDDKMELIRPAVNGTERAIRAGLDAGVERIVVTSSFAAVGYGHPRTRTAPLTEADWTDPDGPDVSPYVESKVLAERRAWELMRAAGREKDLATINPVGIFGPLLDDDPGTSGAIIQRILNGSIPAAPAIQLIGTDVRDVAEAHVRAMTAPEAGGKRFLVSAGGPMLFEAAKLLAERFPEKRGKVPRFAMPNWAVRVYSLIDRDVRGSLGELGQKRTVDASRVTALLGHKLISAEDAIIATGQSLIDRKLV